MQHPDGQTPLRQIWFSGFSFSISGPRPRHFSNEEAGRDLPFEDYVGSGRFVAQSLSAEVDLEDEPATR